MQLVKSLEIAIMAIAGWGFYAANVPALLAAIASSGASVMQATPTLWQALISHAEEESAGVGGGSALSGLRMLVGGEATLAYAPDGVRCHIRLPLTQD